IQILLLLVLSTVVHPAKADHPIDWALCQQGYVKCFIQNKCKDVYAKPETRRHYNLESFLGDTNLLVGSNCDTGVQVIPLSPETVVIHMQVNEDGQNINSIGLYQDNNIIVGCKNSNGKVEIELGDGMNNKYTP
ncbi:hypothetical protein PFISCL1PPCAC_25963, partial [Pristionchus fissidentatus]